jgi:hypothetical protein
MRLVDDSDHRFWYPPAECRACGTGLEGTPVFAQRRHQVTDILPAPAPEVTEHVAQSKALPVLRHGHRGGSARGSRPCGNQPGGPCAGSKSDLRELHPGGACGGADGRDVRQVCLAWGVDRAESFHRVAPAGRERG